MKASAPVTAGAFFELHPLVKGTRTKISRFRRHE